METPAPQPLSGSHLRDHRALIGVIQRLAGAHSLESVMSIVTKGARALLGADGITFVLRDHGNCYYAEEDSISPLWKGKRFPMSACVSGWCMSQRQAVAIEDIYKDSRVPTDAYRPTFVHSLAMAPVQQDQPIAALGAYWAAVRRPSPDECETLQTIANAAALAIAKIEAEHHRAMDDMEKIESAPFSGALGNAACERFSNGRVIFHQSEEAPSGFLITEGCVKLVEDTEEGQQRIFRFASPWDLIGLPANGQYSTTAYAIGDVKVRRLNWQHMAKAAAKSPQLTGILRALVEQKMQSEREHLSIVATNPADERLKSFLIAMGRSAIRRGENGDLISLQMPRGDVASYLSLAPETLSRSFAQLTKNGSIENKSIRLIKIRDEHLRAQINAEPKPSSEKLRNRPGILLNDAVLASLG
jgi:CRP-like cAMP-binding protein